MGVDPNSSAGVFPWQADNRKINDSDIKCKCILTLIIIVLSTKIHVTPYKYINP